jgi:uncharacterized Rmd1/YagE family protein
MTAVAFDGHIDLAELEGLLRLPELRRYPYGTVFALDGEARLYLFRIGALVLQGAVASEPEILAEVELVSERRLLSETRETYWVSSDPARSAAVPRVGWDQVVISDASDASMGAIALLLAQSSALERYERAAERLVDEAHAIASHQARTGRPPRGTRALVRRVGLLMADRLELARWFYLVDRPEETWERPEVALLYDALFGNLELKERHQAMLHKLGAVESSTQVTFGLWHARWSNRLEWAIVLLIVFEILFSLYGLWAGSG